MRFNLPHYPRAPFPPYHGLFFYSTRCYGSDVLPGLPVYRATRGSLPNCLFRNIPARLHLLRRRAATPAVQRYLQHYRTACIPVTAATWLRVLYIRLFYFLPRGLVGSHTRLPLLPAYIWFAHFYARILPRLPGPLRFTPSTAFATAALPDTLVSHYPAPIPTRYLCCAPLPVRPVSVIQSQSLLLLEDIQ